MKEHRLAAIHGGFNQSIQQATRHHHTPSQGKTNRTVSKPEHRPFALEKTVSISL
jgi:hypothetical protein